MMAVCPVCDHEQGGGPECEVCGKLLTGDGGAAAAMPRLLDLEPTLMEYAPGGAPDPVPGFEPNAEGVVEFTGQLEAPVWLEQTAHEASELPIEEASGGEGSGMEIERLVVEPLLEPLLEPLDAPGGEAARPTCRYCRTDWSPGESFCRRCGMKLPVARAEERALVAQRCSQCGLPAEGEVCRSCGARQARG